MNKICWKGRAFKALSYGKNSKKAGRNFSGSITIFHRGGGAKRLLRRIDFQRKNLARGFIERIEYDPNRTARIALVRWSNIKLNDSVEKYNPERAGGIAGNEGASRSPGGPPLRRFASPSPRVLPRPDSDKGPFRRSKNRTLGEPVAGRLKQLSVSRRLRCGPGRQHFEARPKYANSATDYIGRQPKKSSLGVDKVETAFSYILASDQLKSGDEVLNIDTGALRQSMTGNRFIAAPGPTLGATSLNSERGVAGSRTLIISTANLCQKSGISLPLWLAPIGSVIHNIELYPGGGGKLARAAGTSAQLVKKEPDPIPEVPPKGPVTGSLRVARGEARLAEAEVRPAKRVRSVSDPPEPRRESGATLLCKVATLTAPAGPQTAPPAGTGFGPESEAHTQQIASLCTIRLPSGQQQLLDLRCRATIGVVSNIDHRARIFTKAGQRRWLGFRPVVRGVAMNPIDHPHGGGEGRTKGGRPSVSPWGKPTKAGFRGSRKGRRSRHK